MLLVIGWICGQEASIARVFEHTTPVVVFVVNLVKIRDGLFAAFGTADWHKVRGGRHR
jgi:hypothetical protein